MPSLVDARTGRVVARAVELAVTRSARRRGLLDRSSLDPESALVLAPCMMIHTALMRFAIDVLFVNRDGRIVRIVRGLRPWRIAASSAAYATIELAAGEAEAGDVGVGHELYVEGLAGTGFGVDRLRSLSSGVDTCRNTAASPARWGS